MLWPGKGAEIFVDTNVDCLLDSEGYMLVSVEEKSGVDSSYWFRKSELYFL